MIPDLTPSSFRRICDCWKYSNSSLTCSRSFRICLRLSLYSDSFTFSEVRFSSLSVILWISFSRLFRSLFELDTLILSWEVSFWRLVISLWSPKNFCSLSSSSVIAVSISVRLVWYLEMTCWRWSILFTLNESSIFCVQVGQTVFFWNKTRWSLDVCFFVSNFTLNDDNFFIVLLDVIYCWISFSLLETLLMRSSIRFW